MKCTICGNEAAHGYTVYQDSAARGNAAPNSSYLSGKAQELLTRGGKTTYAEYIIPVCRNCVYLSQIKFNIAATVISGILGAVLLGVWAQKFWGIIPLIFCVGNIIFGVVQLIKYINDKPAENIAASSLNIYYNKGLSEQNKQPIFSFENLKSQIGKLGKLAPAEFSSHDRIKVAATVSPTSNTTALDKATLPTCWVFACYDRERAQGLAVLRADFYEEKNVIERVREHLNIPEIIKVKYVEASAWNAPGIHIVQNNFVCDMDEIDSKVNAYLTKAGYSADKPKDAMKTTIPYPNAGLLLIIVNMHAQALRGFDNRL